MRLNSLVAIMKTPESVAIGVLEGYGYSEFCEENGYYSYDFDLLEEAGKCNE